MSSPLHLPLLSRIEKPGRPVLTPHLRLPRWRTVSKVPALAGCAASATQLIASATAALRNVFPMMPPVKDCRFVSFWWSGSCRQPADRGLDRGAERVGQFADFVRSEEHTSELQSQSNL